MKLLCFALNSDPQRLGRAGPSRQWMDDFPDRHAYRCLPLSIANAHGWDILCPVALAIDWNGGPRTEDLTVRALQTMPDGRSVSAFCRSHFSSGIVTFHTDYLFRTAADRDPLATGPSNCPQDGLARLPRIIET